MSMGFGPTYEQKTIRKAESLYKELAFLLDEKSSYAKTGNLSFDLKKAENLREVLRDFLRDDAY